jgi:hypothetical protein
MTNDGQIGFGHLRYQEYLAAEEMNTNRGIDVCPLLQNPWWRGVFVLFARMCQDLDWLIDSLASREAPKACLEGVLAMIKARPVDEREGLRMSLRYLYDRPGAETVMDADFFD